MSIYLTFHQANLNKQDVAIQVLFDFKNNIKIGLEQIQATPTRNPRNPNQIEVAEKVEISPHEYNKFENAQDAYEAAVHFLSEEFKITFDDSIYIVKDEYENVSKSKNIYFYVFEHLESGEAPKLRGVIYVTTSTLRPSVFVAFSPTLEFEYDRRVYK